MTREYSALHPLPAGRRRAPARARAPRARDASTTRRSRCMTDLAQVHAGHHRAGAQRSTTRTRMMLERARAPALRASTPSASCVGVITATDLLGEKPMRFMQERGGTRTDILVADIMTPASMLEAISMQDVAQMRVGPHRGDAEGGAPPAPHGRRGGRAARARPLLRLAHRAPARRRAARPGGRADLRRHRSGAGALVARPLPRGLPRLSAGRSPRASTSPHSAAGAGPANPRRLALLLGGRVRRDAPRSRSRSCSAQANRLSNALAALGVRARRPRRDHPAAAARDRRSPTSRASRWARSRCRCRSCSAPTRSSTASPTAARASRSSIRRRCRTSGPVRARLPRAAST